MADVSITRQMDLSIKNKEFEKFIAFYGQHCIFDGDRNPQMDIVYRTTALLYFLSENRMDKYYSTLQACKDIESYAKVVEVYNSMKMCDIKRLQEISRSFKEAKHTSGITFPENFQDLLSRIVENTQQLVSKIFESKMGDDVVKDEVLRQRILDCIFVMKEHNK